MPPGLGRVHWYTIERAPGVSKKPGQRHGPAHLAGVDRPADPAHCARAWTTMSPPGAVAARQYQVQIDPQKLYAAVLGTATSSRRYPRTTASESAATPWTLAAAQFTWSVALGLPEVDRGHRRDRARRPRMACRYTCVIVATVTELPRRVSNGDARRRRSLLRRWRSRASARTPRTWSRGRVRRQARRGARCAAQTMVLGTDQSAPTSSTRPSGTAVRCWKALAAGRRVLILFLLGLQVRFRISCDHAPAAGDAHSRSSAWGKSALSANLMSLAGLAIGIGSDGGRRRW